MGELTDAQTERQDAVDNACHELLNELCPAGLEVEWDMEHISAVREAVQEVLVDKLHLMTEMEFYPFIEEPPAEPVKLTLTPEEVAKGVEFRFEFPVTLVGFGKTPDEAWECALEGFCQDPGATPEEGDYTVEKDFSMSETE